MEAMFVQLPSLPLLKQDSMEASSQTLRQCQVSQPDVGRLNRKEVRKISSRLKNNQLSGTILGRGRAKFGLIDEFTQLLRDGAVAQFRLMRGSLHGDGQKFSVITF
jgi:hypothetical protein